MFYDSIKRIVLRIYFWYACFWYACDAYDFGMYVVKWYFLEFTRENATIRKYGRIYGNETFYKMPPPYFLKLFIPFIYLFSTTF